jgi:methyl-galactoside transport system ATP-binding protein
MNNEYILELEGLSKQFPGVRALDEVSLKVRPGKVQALMGENGAGKSTLMKCLFGIYHPDAGRIIFEGKEVKFHSTKNALDSGVSMIHQELSNVPKRSVSENIWLGREPLNRLGFLDHRKMMEDTAVLMKQLEISIMPGTQMDTLSISKQQSCEIAKAVSYGARIVVMDEPTSSLTETETEHLFKIIRDLRSRGVAIIYISHKMSEIFQIADEVSVMRDGRMVGSYSASELTEEKLISLMVGRVTQQRFPPIEAIPGDVMMRVTGLTAKAAKSFRDVSFDLRKSEILGIGGLVGAQRTELVEAIFGLRGISAGTITLNGKDVVIRSSQDAIRHGIAMITEDRRGSGIFPLLSITTNTAIAALGQFRSRFGFLDHKMIRIKAKELNDSLRTKTPSMSTEIQNLSGGNQQKVIVSRWLLTLPDILIMDEPTRGIDVGAKYEIYTIMANLVKQGKSIIMVSSEMPELIGMSHRIMVLCAGRHTGTLEKEKATQESIMRLAASFD